MDILPDVLKPGLKVVFCGMAAGNRSALGLIMPGEATNSGQYSTGLA